MNTKSFITYVKRRAPAWSRADILDLLNDIQETVFSNSAELLRYLDESTGRDKILTTTQGTYVYELSASAFGADIHFIENIYQYENPEGYYNKQFLEDVAANTFKATGSTMAKIVFNEDPGDSEYYITCFRKPTPITSENVQPEIPEYMLLKYVYGGVIGLIEMAEHGDSNTYREWVSITLPELMYELNNDGHTLVYMPDTSDGGY